MTTTISTMKSNAQAARELRKALAATYPNTTFKVSSEKSANGGTIRVRWQDGPSIPQFVELCHGVAADYDVRNWNKQTYGVGGPRIPGNVVVWSRSYSHQVIETMANSIADDHGLPRPPIIVRDAGDGQPGAWVDLQYGFNFYVHHDMPFTRWLSQKAEGCPVEE